MEGQVLGLFVVCSQTHSLRDNQLLNPDPLTHFSTAVYQNSKHPPGNLCQEENYFSTQQTTVIESNGIEVCRAHRFYRQNMLFIFLVAKG